MMIEMSLKKYFLSPLIENNSHNHSFISYYIYKKLTYFIHGFLLVGWLLSFCRRMGRKKINKFIFIKHIHDSLL